MHVHALAKNYFLEKRIHRLENARGPKAGGAETPLFVIFGRIQRGREFALDTLQVNIAYTPLRFLHRF